MLKYVIFAVICAGAAALQTPCRNCNSKDVKLPSASSMKAPTGTCKFVSVEPCTAEPCELKKGTNVTIQVSFTANQPTNKLTAEVYGIINKLPVRFPLPNPDACKDSGIQCPLQAGQTYTYTDKLFIQNIYPKLSVVVQWTLKDDNGNPVFCVVIPAKIVS